VVGERELSRSLCEPHKCRPGLPLSVVMRWIAVGGQPLGELPRSAYAVVPDRVVDLQAADTVRAAG
jgi:hypothetical protein